MFTGLVQATGVISRARGGVALRWQPQSRPSAEQATPGPWRPEALTLGESVAVDGVCLTVAERLADGRGFRADVSEETLARTTLAAKADRGGRVNLEPALRLADRLGGHLVSGHVDGLGVVRAIQRQPASWRLELGWQDPAYGRYVCEKASVAVDGVSLTVAGCQADGCVFWIAVIPHTWAETTLQWLRPGDRVNLEADLLAKYAERLLGASPAAQRQAPSEGSSRGPHPEAPISAAWLADHGWS